MFGYGQVFGDAASSHDVPRVNNAVIVTIIILTPCQRSFPKASATASGESRNGTRGVAFIATGTLIAKL
jgi:hypothetical protein